jgi:hypothetical protein
MALPTRRQSLQARIGGVALGGGAPIVVQSMTNTDTADIDATVAQVASLARAGSELVRVTVNEEGAAAAVPHIRDRLAAMGIDVPLVGDFHFNGHRLLKAHPACAEALAKPMSAVFPVGPGSAQLVVMTVEASAGEYRAGDQVWLRQIDPEDFGRALNRDVLAPRPGGRFAFGRMIDRDSDRVALLPPGIGQRQVVIDHPAWIGVAELLVRSLCHCTPCQ